MNKYTPFRTALSGSRKYIVQAENEPDATI